MGTERSSGRERGSVPLRGRHFLLLTLLPLFAACPQERTPFEPGERRGAPVVESPATDSVIPRVIRPSTGRWDRVLENVTLHGDVVVPAGQKWLIGANVRIQGNLRTDAGMIAMRPGSSLRFVGADPRKYVGGGMRYGDAFVDDIGLWIGGTGVLDIRGTPKTGWNRTGTDETWESGDELWIAPTAEGDFEPRRWHPGQPIPRAHPRVPAAEVMNVTRDIIIQGPGHIHISSSRPQHIEHVQLLEMGIVNPTLGDATGRYALHLHMMGEGSRGTVIRGVAAIWSRGKVFVPHASHGVTLIDNVVVNSYGEAFWWDKGDPTHDVLIDRLAVSGVFAPREATGQVSRFAAIVLGAGNNTEIRNSAASGARGGAEFAAGFEWIPANRDENAHWIFRENNVAHNNTLGIRFWNNSGQPHMVRNTLLYNNSGAILNGAYNNSNRYVDVLSIGGGGIHHNSSSNLHVDGGPGRYERVEIYATQGPALTIGAQNLPSKTRQEFIDCVLEAAPGHPKVLIRSSASNPFVAVFRRCRMTPDDVVFQEPVGAARSGSSVIVEQESGRKWEITLDSRTRSRVVREIQ
jgi:hypothetical protein